MGFLQFYTERVKACGPRHFNLCLVLVEPSKTHPDMTERLLTGNQIKQTNKQKSLHYTLQ